jgi:hypothetical protein
VPHRKESIGAGTVGILEAEPISGGLVYANALGLPRADGPAAGDSRHSPG